MKVGLGYDAHRFTAGRPLILGGLAIPYHLGLLGHSDADVLSHAIGDAFLGAVGAGDLGRHFPDHDPAFQDISSLLLLEKIMEIVRQRGYQPVNLDAVVVCEAPTWGRISRRCSPGWRPSWAWTRRTSTSRPPPLKRWASAGGGRGSPPMPRSW